MLPSDHLILKRRANEARRAHIDTHVRNMQTVAAKTHWEVATDQAIQTKKFNQAIQTIRNADKTALEHRRKRLANLLQQDKEKYQQALHDLSVTPDQRKEQIRARAMELKHKREAERQQYVQEQYDRQWRLACDPLRERDSKLILQATNAARSYQIGEKMRLLEEQEREERRFDEIWEAQRRQQQGQEEADALARKKLDAAQKAVLDLQVKELHNNRAKERQLAEEEAAAMRQRAELDADEAKRVAQARQDLINDAYEELDSFNRLKKSQLHESVLREQKEDAERLAYQLSKEGENERKEAEARAMIGSETRLFAEHMLAQKRSLASLEQEQEAARAADNDVQWEKRLQVWGKEQEAREQLMSQVLKEREVQVKTKVEAEKIAKQNEADAREKLEFELQRINQLEALKLDEARKTRMEHRALLEHQIKEKAFERAAAAFNTEQDRLAAQRSEAAYQQKMARENARTAAQISSIRPEHS